MGRFARETVMKLFDRLRVEINKTSFFPFLIACLSREDIKTSVEVKVSMVCFLQILTMNHESYLIFFFGTLLLNLA